VWIVTWPGQAVIAVIIVTVCRHPTDAYTDFLQLSANTGLRSVCLVRQFDNNPIVPWVSRFVSAMSGQTLELLQIYLGYPDSLSYPHRPLDDACILIEPELLDTTLSQAPFCRLREVQIRFDDDYGNGPNGFARKIRKRMPRLAESSSVELSIKRDTSRKCFQSNSKLFGSPAPG
jgi:hypothetical protein